MNNLFYRRLLSKQDHVIAPSSFSVPETTALNQLEQFVKKISEPKQSPLSSCEDSYDANGSSTNGDLSTNQWSNYPLSTTNEWNACQSIAASTSSTWHIQPNSQNLVPSLSSSDMYPATSNDQNPYGSTMCSTNTAQNWQTAPYIAKPKRRRSAKQRKPREICYCPNCSVEGGNKTFGFDGRLQHNCHIPGCDKYFHFPSFLQCHLRTHVDDRPFTCTWYECCKQFKSKAELVRHTKIHIDRRNFPCSRCAMTFKRSDHLENHVYVVHENPKPKKPKKPAKRKLRW